MYDAALRDPAFFRFLLRIDEELASETRAAGCPECSGRLHVADFPRKPRGCPASVIEDYSSRFSFTCGRCEQRATAASVRFLGRRVYVAVVLMLSSPPRGFTVRQLSEQLSVPIRTLCCAGDGGGGRSFCARRSGGRRVAASCRRSRAISYPRCCWIASKRRAQAIG